MNKKKYIIVIIILIILIAVIAVFIIKKPKESNTIHKVEEKIENPDFIIKGSETKKIEEKDIEVKEMKIEKEEGQLKIITELINNSEKELNGVNIILELLDKEGNSVTAISSKINEKVLPKKTFIMESYAGINKEIEDITDIRIVSVEKDDEDPFEDMIPVEDE